jgi:hypothetical protein
MLGCTCLQPLRIEIDDTVFVSYEIVPNCDIEICNKCILYDRYVVRL